MLRKRNPAGTPTGGQFAVTPRDESPITLDGEDTDRARIGREMRGISGLHQTIREPYLRGTSDGAQLAADVLQDPNASTGTLTALARQALRDEIDQTILATGDRGSARTWERHVAAADRHRGQAHALLFAAHRVAQPVKGADWADKRARADADTIRRQMNAPRPEGFWTSVRRSLRFAGPTPTAWHG